MHAPSIPLAPPFSSTGLHWRDIPTRIQHPAPQWQLPVLHEGLIASTQGSKKIREWESISGYPAPIHPYFNQQLPWQQLLQGEMLRSIPTRMPKGGSPSPWCKPATSHMPITRELRPHHCNPDPWPALNLLPSHIPISATHPWTPCPVPAGYEGDRDVGCKGRGSSRTLSIHINLTPSTWAPASKDSGWHLPSHQQQGTPKAKGRSKASSHRGN